MKLVVDMLGPHGIALVLALSILAPSAAAQSGANAAAPVGGAEAASALVPIDYGAGPLPQALEVTVADAIAEAHTLLTDDELLPRWAATMPQGPDAERQRAFVRGTAQRDSGREAFFANDYEFTVQTLAPWLDAVEAEPSVLAFHPDLAPSVLESLLTLVRAYEVLGHDDAADDALRRTVTLFYHATLDASRYPPDLRERFEEVRRVTPTRFVRLDVRGDDDCDVRMNANRVAFDDEQFALPSGAHFLQLSCGGLPGRVHRVDGDVRALQLDPLLDDAVRWSERGVTLAPRSSASLVVSRVVGAAAVRLSLHALYTAGVIESDVGQELMELVRTVPSEGTYRAARVRLPIDRAELDDALTYLETGERRRDDMIVWSESGGWEGLISARRSAAPWVAGSLALAGVSGAVAFELIATAQHRQLEQCASARETADDCVLRGNLPRRRASWINARRRANRVWGVAGGLTVVSAVVIGLTSDGRDRRPEVAVMPGRDSLYTSVRVRF